MNIPALSLTLTAGSAQHKKFVEEQFAGCGFQAEWYDLVFKKNELGVHTLLEQMSMNNHEHAQALALYQKHENFLKWHIQLTQLIGFTYPCFQSV